MNAAPRFSPPPWLGALLLGAALLVLAPPPARAADAWRLSTPAALGPPTVCRAGMVDRFETFIYSTFNSRERMIQLSTIAVCLGLYIMLRK